MSEETWGKLKKPGGRGGLEKNEPGMRLRGICTIHTYILNIIPNFQLFTPIVSCSLHSLNKYLQFSIWHHLCIVSHSFANNVLVANNIMRGSRGSCPPPLLSRWGDGALPPFSKFYARYACELLKMILKQLNNYYLINLGMCIDCNFINN